MERLVAGIRGGASDDESDEEDEYDSSSDEEEEEEEEEVSESEDEYDSDEEYDYDEEEEEDAKQQSSLKSSVMSKSSPEEYDDLLTPPAMQQLMVSVGVMLLSNRIDILDEKAVRVARFAFVAYIVSVQVFLLYVRIRAKGANDRTPVTISNPLAGLVNGGGGGGNFMVKALADQVLSTQTTVLEYDLKQAKKMNSGLLFPMVFLYFLHFKMKQVQPLLMQTATGFLNLVYSPLFQVYVLGRNLERPFKPPTSPMMEAMQKQQEQLQQEEGMQEAGDHEEDGGEDEDGESEEEEEEEVVEEEDASEEDESEDEYDSDEEED